MSASEFVHLEDCDILNVTDRAILIRFKSETHWIPVSQLADGEDHNFEKGDREITVSISEWIAEQKGIDAS